MKAWREYIKAWKSSLRVGKLDELMQKCFDCGQKKELLVTKTIFFAGAAMSLEMPLCRKCWRA